MPIPEGEDLTNSSIETRDLMRESVDTMFSIYGV